MLSLKQQKLILMLLSRKIESKNNGIYNSKAFYKTTSYLRKNGIIYSRKTGDGMTNEYYLTIKGQLLARILASFDDSPEKIRQRYALW